MSEHSLDESNQLNLPAADTDQIGFGFAPADAADATTNPASTEPTDEHAHDDAAPTPRKRARRKSTANGHAPSSHGAAGDGEDQLAQLRRIILGDQLDGLEGQLRDMRAAVAAIGVAVAEANRKSDARAAETAQRLDQLRAELGEFSAKLEHAGADRATLGEMFVQLGHKLLNGDGPATR